MKKTVALGLFSGGLDSILACRVVARQGIRVIALKFVTPFFDYELLEKEAAYQAEMKAKYGLEVVLVDLSDGYLELLRHPRHGFGKNFNPCIDCKVLMLTRARELMEQFQASFLITGEVMGQRPMSQRKDTLRVIEREAGCTGVLLRPLSAKLLPPTKAEEEGLVDRRQLYGFSGRGRKPQIALAKELGISEYPNPAGGCILTDRNLGRRIEQYYAGAYPTGERPLSVDDIQLLLTGRQFFLFGKYWLIVGRNETENLRIASFYRSGDWLLEMLVHPGPTALLRYAETQVEPEEQEAVIHAAAGLIVYYGKKVDGEKRPAMVTITTGQDKTQQTFEPASAEDFAHWQIE